MVINLETKSSLCKLSHGICDVDDVVGSVRGDVVGSVRVVHTVRCADVVGSERVVHTVRCATSWGL